MSSETVSDLERRVSILEDELRELKDVLSAVLENERRKRLADECWRRTALENVVVEC